LKIKTDKFVVIGIGELLWDVFPEGKQLGGAPINFACLAGQLGAEAYPVSCIGKDPLGEALRIALSEIDLDQDFIAEINNYDTGTVQITLDGNGQPSYRIQREVAWDAIPTSNNLIRLAKRTNAVCFGSLAQRNEISRNTIRSFIRALAPDALKIFDVNLRQDIYSKTLIEDSLTLCNILKLSDEELPVLVKWFGLSGSVKEQLKAILKQFDLRLIAYTRGAGGSSLIQSDKEDDHPGYPTNAIDSVGAGDSFTAVLCMGMLNRMNLSEINDLANQVASYVCTQKGGTLILPAKFRDIF
jgi:fructokinase